MSNTRPEQRPDKNGKVVTRHIVDKSSKTVGAVKKQGLGDAPPKISTPAPASKYGNPVDARTSAEGNTYYVEEAPANPNQPFRDPLFNITTKEGISFEIQLDQETGFYYRHPERYGKDLDQIVDWF